MRSVRPMTAGSALKRLPHTPAQHTHTPAVSLASFPLKHVTPRRASAKHVEVVPAHAHPGDALRLARHQCRLPGADRNETLERVVPVAVIGERTVTDLVETAGARTVADSDQPVRV